MQLKSASVSSFPSRAILPWVVSDSPGFASKVDDRGVDSPNALLDCSSGERGEVGGAP